MQLLMFNKCAHVLSLFMAVSSFSVFGVDVYPAQPTGFRIVFEGDNIMDAAYESAETFSPASGSTTYNLTVNVPAAADFIVVSFGSYTASTITDPWATSVTLDPGGNDDSFTFVESSSGSYEVADQWYLQNPSASGSQTLRIILSGSPDENLGTSVVYLSGMLQSGDPIKSFDKAAYSGGGDAVSLDGLIHASTDLAVAHAYTYSGVHTFTGGTEINIWGTGTNYAYSKYGIGSADIDFDMAAGSDAYTVIVGAAYSPAAGVSFRPKHSPLHGPFSGPFGGPL